MYLVVGTGLTGCVISHLIANHLEKKVILIDKRPHVGGNLYDFKDKSGIYIHKYGPHIFHTNDSKIWSFISKFTDWNIYFHRIEAYIDGVGVPIPFNFNSIEKLFPKKYADKIIEELICEYGFGVNIHIKKLLSNSKFKELADYVYKKIYSGYTLKQWGVSPEKLHESILERVPVRLNKDNRYFQDKYQGIPINGYTEMLHKMVNHNLISVHVNTNFKDLPKSELKKFKKIIYTGKIDEYYNYCFEPLEYRSLNFKLLNLDNEFYQRTAQKNFPENYDFTRIVEYKHFLNVKSANTIISFEYPVEHKIDVNEPYYPLLDNKNIERYNKYLELSKKDDHIEFVGRLGDFKYHNMDTAIKRSFNFFRDVLRSDKN